MNEEQEKSWNRWNDQWDRLMSFVGAGFDGVEARIREVQTLWSQPVDPSWLRPRKLDDDKWPGNLRYRRGDSKRPNNGEHEIEATILANLDKVSWLAASLVDGINAIPLANSKRGVEGDLLVLAKQGANYRMYLTEVKGYANHPWYAVVENLRQLKLLNGNAAEFGDDGMCGVFKRRNIGIPSDIHVSGVVLGLPRFYENGQKANAVAPTRKLIDALEADVTLAVWDDERRTAVRL